MSFRRLRCEWYPRHSRLRRLLPHDMSARSPSSSVASAVSPYGGDYLTSLLADKLSSQKIQVTPHAFIKKQIVEGVVANIQKIEYPNTKASYLKYAINVAAPCFSHVVYSPRHEGVLFPSEREACLPIVMGSRGTSFPVLLRRNRSPTRSRTTRRFISTRTRISFRR